MKLPNSPFRGDKEVDEQFRPNYKRTEHAYARSFLPKQPCRFNKKIKKTVRRGNGASIKRTGQLPFKFK